MRFHDLPEDVVLRILRLLYPEDGVYEHWLRYFDFCNWTRKLFVSDVPYIVIKGNSQASLPKSFSKYKRLKTLDLSHSDIVCLPEGLQQHTEIYTEPLTLQMLWRLAIPGGPQPE